MPTSGLMVSEEEGLNEEDEVSNVTKGALFRIDPRESEKYSTVLCDLTAHELYAQQIRKTY